MGLREEILGAEDLATLAVPVPEWKTTVRIRAFSGAERDQWETQFRGGKSVPNVRAKLAALIIVNEKGERVFTDEDAPALGRKSGVALDRIFDAFLKLNKLGKEEAAELEKNSSGAPNANSPSSSASTASAAPPTPTSSSAG